VTSKGWRQPSAFDQILVKTDRALFHANELEADLERVFPEGKYVVAPEIYQNGLRHVYKAKHPPTIRPEWSAIVGDCVHNLRSARDHLAYQLVLRTGVAPNTYTQFPIFDRPPRKRRCPIGPYKRVLPDISPGVSAEIRQVLEVVQPYNRFALGHPSIRAISGLDMLRDLDNIDKHRQLVLVTSTTSGSITFATGGDPTAPPPSTTEWTHKPLAHDNVFAIVTYERPYPQPDPNLFFMVDIAFFDRPVHLQRIPTRVILGELIYFVRDLVIEQQFKQFL
jgi:hypothetical protein